MSWTSATWSPWVLAAGGYALLVNVLGAVLVVMDKRRATRKARRVPEHRLLLCGALGAWPGMGLAMMRVRHKTRKKAFLLPFWAIVLAWLLVILACLYRLG